MVDRLEVLCDRRRSRAPGEMLMRQRSRWVGPADLFADGSVGAWYDPSDHTTLFQDSAGTTPANAPGDPVGLVLDKSQGLRPTRTFGPELVTNGSFDTDTDWTKGTGWTIGSGVASKVVSAGSGLDQNIGALSCPIVEVSYDATVTSGALTPQVLGGGAGVHSGPTISASGSYSVYIIAAVGNDTVRFSGDASFAGSVDNVFVREVIQGMSGTGPELVTNGGFDTDISGWNSQLGAVLTHTGNAMRVVTDGTPNQLATQTLSGSLGNHVELTLDVTITTRGSSPVAAMGGEAFPLPNSSGPFKVIFSPNRTNNKLDLNPGGNGDMSFDNVSVRELPGHHAFQGTNDDYRPTLQQDVNGKWYLAFDGVDDYLETTAIDFTGTDKMSVFAGVHKASDAAVGTVLELSNSDTNPGMFFLRAPATGLDEYQFKSRGTGNGFASYDVAAPTTNIVSGLMEISTDTMIARIDGTQQASGGGDQGTGNYGNYPLYIGARAGTSLFFNGRLYGLTIVGKTTTDAEIASVERYLANKSGVIL